MGLTNTLKLYTGFLRLRLKNGDPREYDRHWEKFWKTVDKTGQDGHVVWDARVEIAAAEDLPRFQSYMDRTVPILDLGCGNGRQSRYLANYFDTVIGADVAPSAIDIARQETKEEKNVVYRVLDATRPEQAEAFHAEFGDVNVYIRTVMHVIQKVDRPKFVQSLKTLLGEKGVLYQIELSSQALNYFRSLPAKGKMDLPPLIERVVEHGVVPVGYEAEERVGLFPDSEWELLNEGTGLTVKTIPIAQGQEGAVPASYLIARPRPAAAMRKAS
ncbi:MAG TPA: class I SAM-dependent methyltransferase [Thermoanaerobaculia bacterium]|jgi:SAM-dependent methyltransferase|nr:class I SAM-dependent methyltransferase [Thermoanaerobaculia bacterium]